jgi:hypothetical protein
MSTEFLIAAVFAVFMIFILALMIWVTSQQMNAADELLVPKRRKLRKSNRSNWTRFADALRYWWKGMSIKAAFEQAWRVL